MATFWTDANINNPKRNFRFKVQISAGAFETDATDLATSDFYWAKTAEKPSFTINAAEHNYLNHTFKFPGRISWNDISITMVDPGKERGVAYALAKMLADSGYNVPSTTSDLSTISKSKAVGEATKSGASVRVAQLDDDGDEIEAWVLKNAFITDAKFGTLDYSSDDLTEYSITFKYDWAVLDNSGGQVTYQTT